MQYVVIGLDGKDEQAPERRTKARPEHIKIGEKLLASGNLWFGAALLNDDGSMKGSMYVVNFTSEKELHEWLDEEPYIVGEVWKEITIHKSNTRDPWQFSKPREFYNDRQ